MNPSTPNSTVERFKRHWDVVVLAIALVYFIARAIYLALNVTPGVPPDEATHFGISQVFADTLLLPSDSADSYRYGLITRVPTAYYYLMGRVANVNVFFDSDLHFLRLANIALAVLTVTFGYLWMRGFTSNKIARSLFVIVVTNIPMFTFLSASISYDNGANLLAAMSLYALTRFFVGRRPEQLGLFFVVLLTGSLVKATFLPLTAALCFALLVHERRNLLHLPRLIGQFFRHLNRQRIVLLAVSLLLVSVNVGLYGVNYRRYGRPLPIVQQVLTLDQCLQNHVFARGYVLQEYHADRITGQEALRAAQRISDEKVRNALLILLDQEQKNKRANQANKSKQTATTAAETPVQMNVFEYAMAWFEQMNRTTFGVLAQISIFKTKSQLLNYSALFVLAAVVFVSTRTVKTWRRPDELGRSTSLYLVLTILAFYLLVLFGFNYNNYQSIGVAALAVQGRYLFPVLVPSYGLFTCFLVCYWPRWLQMVVAAGIALFFLYGDFPFFLSEATHHWFDTAAAEGGNH